MYCNETEACVVAFQRTRGLSVDGVCDHVTWQALVEASWDLGDRTLELRAPNLRGDDVADLQRMLGRLGFDPGRVDGIFGPDTANALTEFQRNVELPPDGICGSETLRAVRRVGGRTGDGKAVAVVREYERLSHGARTLSGRRVVVGQLGGLPNIARIVARALRMVGSTVLTVDDTDGSTHATAANRFAADLYLGLMTVDDSSVIAFYATPGFESLGGHRLAELLHRELTDALAILTFAPPIGMRLPVLRETQMPAALLQLGPTPIVADHGPVVAAAVARALAQWIAGSGDPRSRMRVYPQGCTQVCMTLY